MAEKPFRIVPPSMVGAAPPRLADHGSRFNVPIVVLPKVGPLPEFGDPSNTSDVFGLPAVPQGRR
ncbi:MAG TPA: hypothetical protein VM285_11130 [Polyangia bacterium]|nr:hypothetical protein [Polyangia bacterium]